jgi:hypothetical protein
MLGILLVAALHSSNLGTIDLPQPVSCEACATGCWSNKDVRPLFKSVLNVLR